MGVETAAHHIPYVTRQDAQLMFIDTPFGQLKYTLQLPKGWSEEKPYPVIILMHGAGTRGTDLSNIKGNPFFHITGQLAEFPFVVAAPLCEAEKTWFDYFETLREFTQFISQESYADPERIYLMGASMGGYAVWQMAMSDPQRYAAIVPICGGGMYWNASRLASLPVWAFHGDSDTVVYTEESRKMVEKIQKAGGDARLTIYENCGHNAWTDTYGDPEVFRWLLSHKRTDAKAGSADFTDSKIYG